MNRRSLAALLLVLTAQASMALDWRTPWLQPQNSAAAATNSDEYAWRLFIAINWPADTAGLHADSKRPLGSDGRVVWETWKNASDVYLQDGADPGPWRIAAGSADAARELRRTGEPSVVSERRFEGVSPQDFPNLRHIVDGAMVPVIQPLSNARRLVEVRMNRISFEYIRARELYNVDGQLKSVSGGRSVHFPPGAVQVKASWRPISLEQRPRYHTVTVKLADGSSRLYGLTALNIASKDLPNWFWASFEHVDNPLRPDGEGWQLKSRDTFACRNEAADCNRSPSGIGLEATVWQYYRLRGTLTAFVDSANRPQLLGNSELEAGLQTTASCITCHSRASIGVVDGVPARLPVFDTGAQSAGDPIIPRGYVGLPRREWFDSSGAGGLGHPAFQALDFVWSLSQARPRRQTSAELFLHDQQDAQ